MRRLFRALRRATDDRDVKAELALHLEMETEDLVAQGVPRAEARRRASLALGGVERFRAEARDVRRGAWLSALPGEMLWAWRGVRGRGLGAFVHIAFVAVAVGATATVFSAADAFVFRPSPYPNASRLVTFQRTSPVGVIDSLEAGERLALTGRSDLFTHWYTHALGPTIYLNVAGVTESVRTYDVQPGLFDALGIVPRWGRPLALGDAGVTRELAVLVREDLARGLFGDPAAAVGQTITSGTDIMRVVGVMPARFRFPTAIERIWRPLGERGGLSTIAAVAPGVSMETVEHVVDALASTAVPAQPRFMGPVRAVPLSSATKDPRAYTNSGAFTSVDAPHLFTMLLGAALCVTLIICFNMAGLSLARSLERARVYVVQTALGATRGTLVRTAFFEDAILTVLGALAGIGLAAVGTAGLSSALPSSLAVIVANPIDLDVRTAVFIAGVALGASVLTSFPVVWHVSRPVLADALRRGAPNLTASRAQTSARYLLMAAQVGLSVLLLVVAILFARSYGARLDTKGFDSANLATIEVTRPRSSSRSAADLDQAIVAQLQVSPAVRSFSRTARLLPSGPRGGTASHLWIQGAALPSGFVALFPFDVDPAYFGTMGIRLLSGRVPRAGDSAEQIVVDESFARRFWPNGDALGARFSLGGDTSPGTAVSEIIGVASHVQLDTAAMPQGGDIYVVHRALKSDAAPLTYVVRLATGGGMRNMTTLIRSVAEGCVVRATPIDDRYADSYGTTRIAAGIGSAFGGVALLVAIVGMYGVTTLLAVGRTREIGVRLALGASRRDIQRLVLGPAMVFAGLGAVVGAGAALAASRWVESQLFGVSATDPATYVSTILAVAVAALAATWRPARRAARIDPAVTLRAE